MEVFNKFYYQVSNSVSNTVSQLSGVLPGNPVTREYESFAHIASAGPGLLWKIYKGRKKSTKQEASIFVFEKRQLEKWNKTDRDFITDSLRRGVQQLTKIRHPQVLTVQHPLEESRESLAFATEPVFVSLANICGGMTNMPQPANMSDYTFFDVEFKYGLLQLTEGLMFLHNDVKLLHKNICPESIVINSSGVWKVFGLDFCTHNTNPPNTVPNYPFQDYSPTLPAVCQPNLNYLAPECILTQNHSPASDMFSLGMLVYTINSRDKQCLYPINDINQFKSRTQQLKNLNLSRLNFIPSGLREFVKSFLCVSPETRPDAHEFLRISYFDDVCIKTLTHLDKLLQWDNLQKSQFYKELPSTLSKFPLRVKLQRILTSIVRDLGQPVMVPFILPSIFDIAQECSQQEYCTFILVHLKPLMKLTDPIQILLLMLQKMELLLRLTPADDIQQHVLPMLYRGLDSDSSQIHELCLTVLPTFAQLIDHTNFKNSVLPRIKKLCLSTSNLSVRVNCLLCLGKILENLDRWLVIDEVLPFLPQIPSREPAVLMAILGIYKLAMNHKKLGISKEIMASRILPFLIPLCIENSLTIAQFNAMVQLVKDMFQVVENEHRTKLEQLNTIKNEQSILTSNMPNVASNFDSGQKDVNQFSSVSNSSYLPQKQECTTTQETSLSSINAFPENIRQYKTHSKNSKELYLLGEQKTNLPIHLKTNTNPSLTNIHSHASVDALTCDNLSQNTAKLPVDNFFGGQQFDNCNLSSIPQHSHYWKNNQSNMNFQHNQKADLKNWNELVSFTSQPLSKVPINLLTPLQTPDFAKNQKPSDNSHYQLSKEDIVDLLS